MSASESPLASSSALLPFYDRRQICKAALQGGWQRLYSWVAYRLRPCFMQTVGHSSPVLSCLLTAPIHYSLARSAANGRLEDG
jgi:hypothetical protein